MIFNMVFFIVLTSALIQGTTIPLIAKWLGVDAPIPVKPSYPIECEPTGKMKCDLTEIVIHDNSAASNKRILELGLPDGTLVVLINRGDDFFVPAGGTVKRFSSWEITHLSQSEKVYFVYITAQRPVLSRLAEESTPFFLPLKCCAFLHPGHLL